ncbi:hydroxyacylglutathione hydrolase [Shimia sp.]|uniref:hydroxyacylglutathione hydrolase n=1 Tax=Shimia sp. TaxID=1954381 RepID=UPI00356AC71C
MPLEIVTLPCLSDNYCFLLHDADSGATAVVDVPDAAVISEALAARGWTLGQVLLTHHHWDHVDGLPALLEAHPAQVIGAKADAHRLPPLDLEVAEGDGFLVGSEPVEVLEVPGHTLGHIAFYLPNAGAVFTADSLMAMGCGRLFEGDPAMMWASLCKLAALPAETLVCSGHEYTEANARFAKTVDPDNPALAARIEAIAAARAAGRPTVPSRLSEELDSNPFLRATAPEVARHLGMTGADPEHVFAEIRKRKDNF